MNKEQQQQWSFGAEDNDLWGNDLYDTREETEKNGRDWAIENGLAQFVVGKFEPVPIPTDIELENLFESLDNRYYNACGNPDADLEPFYESDTPENKEAQERLLKKLSEAIQEYVDEAGIVSNWLEVVETKIIEVHP